MNKVLPIAIGVFLSILLFCLPFLSWGGSTINEESTSLWIGVQKMMEKDKVVTSLVCVLIGLLPLISAIQFTFRKSNYKLLILASCLMVLALQIYGAWMIHIEFLIDNYGKVNWRLSFGYYLYLISQLLICTLNILIFVSSIKSLRRN